MSFWNKIKDSANKLSDSESWESIKKVASNIGCKVGAHSGNYQYVDGQPKCYMEYTCSKCNQLITKNNHKFPNKDQVKYHKGKTCEKELKCEYCDTTKIVLDHEYWNSKGVDGVCNKIEQCSRCFIERKNGKQHHFHRTGTQGSKIIVECYNCKCTELKDTWYY